MIVCIFGSRTITNYFDVDQAVKDSGLVITKVIAGGARGVDKLAEEWARINGVPCQVMEAHWDLHGRKAGYLRNQDMEIASDAGIAVWDGMSKGTRHTITLFQKANKPLWIRRCKP